MGFARSCLSGDSCKACTKPIIHGLSRVLLLAGICFFYLSMALLASAAPLQKLEGHLPAAAAGLQPLDNLPGSRSMNANIALQWRNMDDFHKLLDEIYDPASTNYHHFITPQQFTEKFGPSETDYQTVIDFATAHGLKVTHTFQDHTLIAVSGTVSNIQEAFHVILREYQHPTENRHFFAPDSEPSVDLQVPILHIGGLDNFVVPHPMSLRKAASSGVHPAASDGSRGGNYIGSDFRAAYVQGVTLTGTGQSVGLLEFDGYYTNDIATYRTLASLPNVPVTNVLLNGFSGSPGTNNVEVALDIEMAMSMAPGLSNIVVYEGVDTDTILAQMLNDNSCKQLSASWTYSVDSASSNYFQLMGAQGQTFFNASGDSGAYTSSKNPVAPPTDDPYIMVVGGTSLSTSGAGGPWSAETVWNWYTTGEGKAASSGGVSPSNAIPVWQQNISMTANKGSTSHRNLPDVAMTADNIFVVANNGEQGEVGGTSAACPLWAAFNALVNEQAAASGLSSMGYLNPAIYAIGKGTNYTNCFHDIITGNNTNSVSSTKYFAVTNYDLCTGWGTPIGANLIAALVPSAPVITSQPTNTLVAPGNNATFYVTASSATQLFYNWRFNGTNINAATSSTYTIVDAQTNNQGIYSVVVSNSIGSVTSSNAMLTVNSPPVIAAQPQSITVAQGNNATFSVTTTGLPTPNYQWQFNGTNIALATNTSFTITNAQLTNQGAYSVTVSNTGGMTNSAAATLTVDAPPIITTEPSNRTINQGGSATLIVFATGSPTLAFQWFFEGNLISGATSAGLTLTNVQFNQAGQYWATVSNAFGVTNSTPASIFVDAPPTITNQPQGISLIAGNNATFTVGFSGSTPVGYQWFYNSGALTDGGQISGSRSATLVISNLLVRNAGSYQVLVSNAYGATNSVVATLTVAKATPILVWTNPNPIVYGTVLNGVELNATANQPGTFSYTPQPGATLNTGTQLLSTIFTPSDTDDYNLVTNSVSEQVLPAPLSIVASNATRFYGRTNPIFGVGIFGVTNGDIFTTSATCSATNTSPLGTYPIVPGISDPNNRLTNYTLTSSNGTLTIIAGPAPEIFSITPNSGTTNGGLTVTIIGTNFEQGATVYFGTNQATSVVVTNCTNIFAVTPSNSLGTVDVLLTNADGGSFDLTNAFSYIIPMPPQITSEPTNQSVTAGGSATFALIVTGTAPLAYQWSFNQTHLAGATNSTFMLANVQAANAGPYQVVVTNLYGSATSSVATLSIPGSAVVFGSSAGGSEGLRYTNGQFVLTLSGLTGQGPVVIQSSTDLTNWTSIYTNPPGFGQIQFIDTNAANMPWNFYRAVTPAAP